MTASLRPFARSRGLRALSVLAWLMVVVTSLAAAPLGMTGPHGHAMHAATAAVGEPAHHEAAASHAAGHDCCDEHGRCGGGASVHMCGCAGMCASVLPSAPMAVAAATALTGKYASPVRLGAPTIDTAPPLRPPSV